MHETTPRAVFVDPTGRRHRLVARTCWTLGVLGVAYVALVVVSLLLPPGLSRLAVPGLGQVLPGPAAAPLGATEADGEVQAPDVLLAPSPSRSAAPRRTSPTPRPQASARPTPARTAGPAPAPRPTPSARTASPTPGQASPSPRGAAPGTPPGRDPSAGPSRSSAAPATPPGQQRSPRPRPSRSPR